MREKGLVVVSRLIVVAMLGLPIPSSAGDGPDRCKAVAGPILAIEDEDGTLLLAPHQGRQLPEGKELRLTSVKACVAVGVGDAYFVEPDLPGTEDESRPPRGARTRSDGDSLIIDVVGVKARDWQETNNGRLQCTDSFVVNESLGDPRSPLSFLNAGMEVGIRGRGLRSTKCRSFNLSEAAGDLALWYYDSAKRPNGVVRVHVLFPSKSREGWDLWCKRSRSAIRAHIETGEIFADSSGLWIRPPFACHRIGKAPILDGVSAYTIDELVLEVKVNAATNPAEPAQSESKPE